MALLTLAKATMMGKVTFMYNHSPDIEEQEIITEKVIIDAPLDGSQLVKLNNKGHYFKFYQFSTTPHLIDPRSNEKAIRVLQRMQRFNNMLKI